MSRWVGRATASRKAILTDTTNESRKQVHYVTVPVRDTHNQMALPVEEDEMEGATDDRGETVLISVTMLPVCPATFIHLLTLRMKLNLWL